MTTTGVRVPQLRRLNALYLSAAAIRLYMKEAFNAKTSLIISFAYLLRVVAVIAADSYVVGSAVTCALNLPRVVTLVLILALLALTALATLRGIRIAGLLQDITTYALLVSAVLISVIGLVNHGLHFHTWASVCSSISTGQGPRRLLSGMATWMARCHRASAPQRRFSWRWAA
jgi:amino acid transporter